MNEQDKYVTKPVDEKSTNLPEKVIEGLLSGRVPKKQVKPYLGFPDIVELDALSPETMSEEMPIYLYLAVGSHEYKLGKSTYQVSIKNATVEVIPNCMEVDKYYKLGNSNFSETVNYKSITTDLRKESDANNLSFSGTPSYKLSATSNQEVGKTMEIAFEKEHVNIKAISNNRWRLRAPLSAETFVKQPFEGVVVNFMPFCLVRSAIGNHRYVTIAVKVRPEGLRFQRVSKKEYWKT